ncbi:MAG: type toxin-antitoxin system HicB family antitoxin [Alphaproteobacteria bacterium]|nr:type toxin-antitoxin system HicB family antitoxin [Alphaproteobacteria bacterium]
MPRYRATIIPGEEGLVLVTFPDVPEAVACGSGEDTALEQAAIVLGLVLDGYRSEHRPIPLATEPGDAPSVSVNSFG